jgi:hypothetical protein
MTSLTVAPYRTRRVRFAGLALSACGTLKLYTISADHTTPDETTITAALHVAHAYLAAPAKAMHVAGVHWHALPSHAAGALIVHRGADATFAVLDWWVGTNMLRHHVWAAPNDRATAFASLAGSDVAMCVWELAVIQHERAAWLRHVFTPHGTGDLDAYLADTIDGDY